MKEERPNLSKEQRNGLLLLGTQHHDGSLLNTTEDDWTRLQTTDRYSTLLETILHNPMSEIRV